MRYALLNLGDTITFDG